MYILEKADITEGLKKPQLHLIQFVYTSSKAWRD